MMEQYLCPQDVLVFRSAMSILGSGQIEAAKNQLAQSSPGLPGTAVSPDLCPSPHNQAL